MGYTEYPRINIRINQSELKKFKLLKDHGFSAREVLVLALNNPCEDVITVTSKINGLPIQFPRNILSQRKK
jgi:hypothetical protein